MARLGPFFAGIAAGARQLRLEDTLRQRAIQERLANGATYRQLADEALAAKPAGLWARLRAWWNN